MTDSTTPTPQTKPLRQLLQELRENRENVAPDELLAQIREAARKHKATFEVLSVGDDQELCPHCQSPALRTADTHIHMGFACEFTQTSCGMINQVREEADVLAKQLDDAHDLLRRIAQWDHMDSTADGPYWRSEITQLMERPVG